ncbi:MAG TPA: hypothetical protein VFI86_09020 [Burkholderiales bacterium]|nr:hypothetical protein [Burkholderiales bacterium]
MKRALVLVLGILLAGCASNGANLRPGVSDAAAVRSDMGAPADTLRLADGGQAWFYPKGWGRVTYRVELGPDERVRKVEQVLDEYYFNQIQAGKTTRQDLYALLGPPFYVWHTRNETVWEYRYLWAQQSPWILRVGIGANDVVTGQARIEETDANNGGHSG